MNITEQAEALAKSVHAALSQDLGVQHALGGTNGEAVRLYDTAPEDPVYPYLTYGAMRSEDIGADDTPLSAHRMTLHVWSRYAGRAEVLSLLSTVSAALQASVLSATGHISVRSAGPVYSDVLRAADGRTHHGLARLAITTQAETSQGEAT